MSAILDPVVRLKEQLCLKYGSDPTVANVCRASTVLLWTMRPVVGQLSDAVQRLTGDLGSLVGLGAAKTQADRGNADLTSIILLLVSLYFGFTMLVRTTRMVYGFVLFIVKLLVVVALLSLGLTAWSQLQERSGKGATGWKR